MARRKRSGARRDAEGTAPQERRTLQAQDARAAVDIGRVGRARGLKSRTPTLLSVKPA